MWASRDYRRLLKVQLALDKQLVQAAGDTAELALIARTLVTIIDTKRVLRMRPKPRDVDTLELERMKMHRVKAITIEEADPKESLLGEGGGRSGRVEGSNGQRP